MSDLNDFLIENKIREIIQQIISPTLQKQHFQKQEQKKLTKKQNDLILEIQKQEKMLIQLEIWINRIDDNSKRSAELSRDVKKAFTEQYDELKSSQDSVRHMIDLYIKEVNEYKQQQEQIGQTVNSNAEILMKFKNNFNIELEELQNSYKLFALQLNEQFEELKEEFKYLVIEQKNQLAQSDLIYEKTAKQEEKLKRFVLKSKKLYFTQQEAFKQQDKIVEMQNTQKVQQVELEKQNQRLKDLKFQQNTVIPQYIKENIVEALLSTMKAQKINMIENYDQDKQSSLDNIFKSQLNEDQKMNELMESTINNIKIFKDININKNQAKKGRNMQHSQTQVPQQRHQVQYTAGNPIQQLYQDLLQEAKQIVIQLNQENLKIFKQQQDDYISQAIIQQQNSIDKVTNQLLQEQISLQKLFKEFKKTQVRDKVVAQQDLQVVRQQIQNLKNQFQQQNVGLVSFKKTVQLLMKLSELILILLQCDEKDKQNIQLTGYNERQARNKERQVVSVKQECASCSKFSPGIFTAFKMACLTYNPSKINYKDRVLTRDQAIDLCIMLKNWLSQEIQQITDIKSITPQILDKLPQEKPKRVQSAHSNLSTSVTGIIPKRKLRKNSVITNTRFLYSNL